MHFIWSNKFKRTMAIMTAVLVLFYSYPGMVWAEEDSSAAVVEDTVDEECSHSAVQLIDVIEATCVTDGFSGNTICTSCGRTVANGSVIPAKGHHVVEDICTNCGKQYGVIKLLLQPQTIVAGDEFKVEVVLEKNPGIVSLRIEYQFDASRLELISVEDKQILTGAVEFNENNLVWEDKICTEDNVKTDTIAVLTLKAKEDLYGSTEIVINKVEAFDTNSEKEEFTNIEKVIVDVSCGHEWGEGIVTVEPTCDTDGEMTYTCVKDSSHTKTEVIERLGHSWGDGIVTKEATCTQNGEMTYTCVRDSSHTKAEEIEKLGHEWDEGKVIKEAGCEEEGEIFYTCKRDSSHTKTEIVEKKVHDYAIIEYKKPTKKQDGYEKYQCTLCGDEYTEVIPNLGADEEPEYEYDDVSGATSDSLTFYVGYFGMDFVEKTTLTLDEIMNGCSMVTQTYTYINKRPRVVYDVATGPTFVDVMDLAGVDAGAAQSYLFATADSAGNYYDASQITSSNLFATRFFFPNLNNYFLEDGSFSDVFGASRDAETVEPMLAIWDSWITYGIEQEFDEALHASNMKSGNCFRLLYGQSQIGEISAITSAKWINTIYVQYRGKPSIDAGEDLNLSISSDHTVTASVSAVDDALQEVFQNSIKWSSSDESVLKVNEKTGKITVVGEGTAVITATSEVEGVSTTDSITVNISADAKEDLEGGGSGDGSGTGDGDGTGEGDGDGTGKGEGENVGPGEQENGSGDGTETDNGAEDQTNEIPKTEDAVENKEQIIESDKKKAELTETETEKDKIELTDTETEEEKIELTEEESVIENIGKTIKAIPLNFEEELLSEGQTGGQSGGGDAGNIVLSLTQNVMWYWAALFAAGMFLCGGTIMYGKYKREF